MVHFGKKGPHIVPRELLRHQIAPARGAGLTDHAEFRKHALLTLQEALLGEVRPEMRAVVISLRFGVVRVIVVTDREPTEAERENFVASVMTQLMASSSYPDGWLPQYEHEFLVLPASERVDVQGSFAFMRWEPKFNEGIFTEEEQQEIDEAERRAGRYTT